MDLTRFLNYIRTLGGAPQTAGAPGAQLINGWPQMLTNGTRALPSPAGLPATIGRSGLPAVMDAAAPGAAGGAGLGAASSALGPLGFLLGSTKPANQGETPFYVIDPLTGKMVPNPQAAGNMPAGSFGFGGGFTPQAPQYGVPTNYDGSNNGTAGGSIPLPRPRPAMPTANSQMAPNQPLASGPSGPSGGGNPGSDLFSSFIKMLMPKSDPNQGTAAFGYQQPGNPGILNGLFNSANG